MAERTWRDHWYDEQPKEKPYYQVTGSRLITDASKLFPQSPEVSVEQERLALAGKLELDGPPTRVVSSERSVGLSYVDRSSRESPGARPCGGKGRCRPQYQA